MIDKKVTVTLPDKYNEDHPLNANNKKILHEYILANLPEGADSIGIEKRVNALHAFLLDHADPEMFDISTAGISAAGTAGNTVSLQNHFLRVLIT